MKISAFLLSGTLAVAATVQADVLAPGMTVGETHHLGHGELWWAEVDVASSPDGYSLFAWESGLDVKMRIFDSQGRPVTEETRVGSYLESMKIDIAATSDGSFFVSWYGFDPADDMFTTPETRARVFRADGTPTSDTRTIAPSAHAGVTATNDGNFIAAWSLDGEESSERIVAQRYDSKGELLGEQIHVANLENGRVLSLDVASVSEGQFVVAWRQASVEEGAEDAIWFRRLGVSGDELEDPELVSSGKFHATDVVSGSDGSFLIKWHEQTDTGSAYRINRYTVSTVESVDASLAARASHIVAKPGGGYIFIWSEQIEGERKQFFRHFSEELLPLDEPVAIEPLDWWLGYTTHQVRRVGVSATGTIAFAYEDDNQEYIGRLVAGTGVDLAVEAATNIQSVMTGSSIELNITVANDSRANPTGNRLIDDAVGRADGVSITVSHPGDGLNLKQTSNNEWYCTATLLSLYSCEYTKPLAAGEVAPSLVIAAVAEYAGEHTLLVTTTAGNTGDIDVTDNIKEISFRATETKNGGGAPSWLLLCLLISVVTGRARLEIAIE